MARVKGGLGAKKRHNRTLKLAKGYRGARSKQYREAKQSVMRKKETVPSVMDRSYQRSSKNERNLLQPDDARIKSIRYRYQP